MTYPKIDNDIHGKSLESTARDDGRVLPENPAGGFLASETSEESIRFVLKNLSSPLVDPLRKELYPGGIPGKEPTPANPIPGNQPILAQETVVDSVGLYLKEMSRVPLLTTEEEIELAKRIDRGNVSRAKLNRANHNLTAQKRENLRRLVQDGLRARNHLIKANTRLVVSVAKKHIGRGVPFLDLIQEGNLGLMKAVEKYDYRRGFRFSTYATWWIRQTITRSIAEQGRTIRIPVHMIDRIRQLYRKVHELEQQLGRPPALSELAAAMGLDEQRVQWMVRISWLPLSLENPIGDEEDSELGMFVEDNSTPTPTQITYQNMLRDKVDEVLASLSPREARIIRLRFGLEDGHAYTLEEVGQKFGLTRERIRQIEGKALRRLRHPSRARQLKDYL